MERLIVLTLAQDIPVIGLGEDRLVVPLLLPKWMEMEQMAET